jgi:hypothetical protein
MTEEALDGPDVGPGFKQVRCPASLRYAGASSGFVALRRGKLRFCCVTPGQAPVLLRYAKASSGFAEAGFG